MPEFYRKQQVTARIDAVNHASRRPTPESINKGWRMASGAWLGLKTCHSSQMKTAPQQWVPVTTIQKLMGHAWLVSTQTYIAANDRKVQADFYAAAQQLAGWQDEPKQGAA